MNKLFWAFFMKYIQKLLFVTFIFYIELIEASYFNKGFVVLSKAKNFVITKTKDFQNKFKTNEVVNSSTTQSKVYHEAFIPQIAQAAKTESEQTATDSGFLSFPNYKNSTTTINQNTYNYNYAKKTWHESFSQWIQNGKQTRAAATGFVVGAASGYGLHAVIRPAQKEKNIAP